MIGRVYKIINSDESIMYIGSTTQTLQQRWRMHKNNYRRWTESKGNNCSIFSYFKEHGVDAFSIHLVSEHQLENRKQLCEFEQLLIDRSVCVNQVRAHRSADQLKESVREASKRYNLNHREKRQTKAQEYRQANPEKIHEQRQQYYQEKKDEVLEKSRQYYQEHKEQMMERKRQWRLENRNRQREQTDCECGGKYTHAGRSIHFKTRKHQSWVESLSQ